MGWALNDVLASKHHVEVSLGGAGPGGVPCGRGGGTAWSGVDGPWSELQGGHGSGSLCWGRAVSGHISRQRLVWLQFWGVYRCAKGCHSP